jgi:uncharacterized protein YndB with AHSA1/START domain
MTHPLQGTLENRDGTWVLTMRRELAQPPEKVWPWLTDPIRLAQWSPVVPDRAFDGVGPRQVRENPGDDAVDGEVLSVDPPYELVHRWGPDTLRWRLTPRDAGCVLTLEHSMAQRDPAAMNAAGWHLCLDVLADNAAGSNTPRVVGPDAVEHGWESLRDDYAELLASSAR